MLRGVIDEPDNELLKGVSRSFYLSLRLLPRPMRRAAGLGYLLARTSDTIADSAAAPVDARLEWLGKFGQAVNEPDGAPVWPREILNATPDSRERILLERTDAVLRGFRAFPTGEAALVREVVEIIISGQTLDLQRFRHATAGQPVALANDAELEDYAWRVAGCVGAFWTKLGFHTLGGRFSHAPEAELLKRGIAYGKGLQLVNILRDVAEDRAAGRCYLPVADPSDIEALMDSHAAWRERAGDWLEEGEIYSERLVSKRLRAATVLPALIGRKTLDRMRGASWQDLQTRIKIPRGDVYRALARAIFHTPRRS